MGRLPKERTPQVFILRFGRNALSASSAMVLVFCQFSLFLFHAWSEEPEANFASMIRDREEWEGKSLAEVVMAATGRKVLPVDPGSPWLDELATMIDKTLAALNDPDHPVHHSQRINEASRFIEDDLLKCISSQAGWSCRVPLTEEGNTQRSGYPDIEVTGPGGTVIYIDPKLHHEDNLSSSLRTFYYEPQVSTNKITRDAYHLLLGVAHHARDGRTVFTGWQLIDASRIPLRLKMEFQSSNRDIYRPENLVRSSNNAAPQ